MSTLSKPRKGAVINKPRIPLGKRVCRDFQMNWRLYLLFLPVLAYFIVFKYAPMAGLVISFQDYKAAKGITGSKWVAMKHFINFFNDPYLPRLLRNTFTIALSTLIFSFPSAIVLALLINELRSRKMSRVVQTISYIPHFISVVVVCQPHGRRDHAAPQYLRHAGHQHAVRTQRFCSHLYRVGYLVQYRVELYCVSLRPDRH